MKTKKILFALLFLLPFNWVKADEGMWFLMHIDRLNHRDMQQMGLQLTAEEIYSVNHSSLKDAIVQFGGGCTAEIVSKDGLVLTNHHCGYGAIAELSSPEHNYLSDGFWAANHQEELKPKSLSVRFFVRMDDVSERILGKVDDNMSEIDREKVINQEIAFIERENSEGGKYVVSVKSFYNGNEYYYFVYQDYNDVRLVGTPPNSIGKFGGDTDNWEWPRHTGDFSLFRVYTDRDGNPTEYAQTNIPLKPKYHLPISLKGFQENDFAMILGYPGRTNRWMPSAGIDQNVNYAYPAWVEASKVGMDNMKKHMDNDPKVKLEYASKYAQVANYWKNRQGMIDALQQHETAKTKRIAETAFNKWANKRKNRARYGEVIPTINGYYEATNEQSRHDNYLIGMLRSSTFAALPYVLGNTLQFYADANDAKRQELLPKIQTEVNAQYDQLYLPLEQDVLNASLKLYAAKAQADILAPLVASLAEQYDGDFSVYIKEAFKTSIFSSKEKIDSFLTNPDVELLAKDPLYLLSSDLMDRYRHTDDDKKQAEASFQQAFRLMVEGMRKANPKKVYYPDANSTLRLTYGKIISLPPDSKNDAQENYYTTLKGTIAKYRPNDEEFDLPQKLIDLYEAKDFGPYADQAGHMPVNLLTDNDITGGNSGSPVINGNGELIGIAFDGNIEAMAGDVIFDHELQRTISVDIRYVLFIIDKFAGAKHLVDEMTLVQ
ncbi:S46 family peptidase [Olivibacter sp. SDN3]|uniref:S46 family peptidase n=1 Tax=Olivibacter sp. SDN3 TaxID=2764720 RepID=UPI0016514E79|nr:S46 family peptidase [Olivibacter sp. SDN3]QNL51409.1 S46 family peptidase [Olivibacter sp. SDN3]